MIAPNITAEEVRVEPITDDERERLRELLLQVQNLVAGDE